MFVVVGIDLSTIVLLELELVFVWRVPPGEGSVGVCVSDVLVNCPSISLTLYPSLALYVGHPVSGSVVNDEVVNIYSYQC